MLSAWPNTRQLISIYPTTPLLTRDDADVSDAERISALTVDPGYIRILMSYGFMRAYDAVYAPGQADVWQSSNDIFNSRIAIWQKETRFFQLVGNIPRIPGGLQPSFNAHVRTTARAFRNQLKELALQLRNDKRSLAAQTAQRKNLGGAVFGHEEPPWEHWEEHSWQYVGNTTPAWPLWPAFSWDKRVLAAQILRREWTSPWVNMDLIGVPAEAPPSI